MTETGDLVADYLRSRSEQDFRLLYQRCTPRLMGFAHRLAGGDALEAEELVQETWVRAVRQLDRFRPDGELARWLNGIAVNCWRESRRRADRRGETELPDAGQLAAPPAEDPLDAMALRQAIESLPEGFRTVLLLHDVEGYTHEEIAALLDIVPGTSKSQLARARQAMRARLHQHPGAQEV